MRFRKSGHAGVHVALAAVVLSACSDPMERPSSSVVAQSAGSEFRINGACAEDRLETTVINQRLVPVRLYGEGEPYRRLLMAESSELTMCEAGEGPTVARIHATATEYDAEGLGQAAWVIEAIGSTGHVDEAQALYRVTASGCCGTNSVDTYFDLYSGVEVMAASGRILRIDLPKIRDRRFISYHDNVSAIGVPEAVADSTVIGVIQFGDGRRPAARVALHSRRSVEHRLDRIALTVELAEVMATSHSDFQVERAEDLTGVGVRLVLVPWQEDVGPVEVVVLVRNDRLDLESATLPSDYWLETFGSM